MILRTGIRTKLSDAQLHAYCTEAEHEVAVQAERDTRRYIPSATGALRSSGRVYGNVIVWDRPYATIQYFGKMYVDPETGAAAFPTATGWRNYSGKRKVRSDRDYHHANGGSMWFYRAKQENLERWLRVAKGVIEHG